MESVRGAADCVDDRGDRDVGGITGLFEQPQGFGDRAALTSTSGLRPFNERTGPVFEGTEVGIRFLRRQATSLYATEF